MKPKHRSANERTSARVARIAARILKGHLHSGVYLYDARGKIRDYVSIDSLTALAASALTQTADKASTPRHRRTTAPRPQSKKAGTKSRGKGAKPLGHYTPRKIELRKRKG